MRFVNSRDKCMTRREIYLLVREQLGKSAAVWARENGYDPNALRQMLFQWENRADGHPGGDRALMAIELSVAIGKPIFPAIKTQVEAMIAKNRGQNNGTKSRQAGG